MGGTPSVCTCLTRACAYNKKTTADTITEEGPAEDLEAFDDDISKMVTKTLDNKKGAKIVSEKKVYDQLKADIANSNIPKELLITGSCIGFCNAVEAKCSKPNSPEPPTPTQSTEVTADTEATKEGFRRRRSIVSCTTLIIAITAIALLLWSISRRSQRKPSVDVPTNVSIEVPSNTARLSDASA